MSSDDGYYVKGTCGCACDFDRPCFYHGCADCCHTRESAAKAGLVSGHTADCKYRPRLETTVL